MNSNHNWCTSVYLSNFAISTGKITLLNLLNYCIQIKTPFQPGTMGGTVTNLEELLTRGPVCMHPKTTPCTPGRHQIVLCQENILKDHLFVLLVCP